MIFQNDTGSDIDISIFVNNILNPKTTNDKKKIKLRKTKIFFI